MADGMAAAAFAKAEESAKASARRGGVAAAGCGGEGSAVGVSAWGEAAQAAVIVAVHGDEGDVAAVAVGALLLVRLGLAEAVVDDVVVLVDTALHVGFAAAGEERQGSRCEEWCSDLGGAFHRN